MGETVRVKQIDLYPLKSFDPVSVEAAELLPAGPFQHDRRWRLIDAQGKTFNAKRSAAIQTIRSRFSDHFQVLEIAREVRSESSQLLAWQRFELILEAAALEQTLSDWLQTSVTLEEDALACFPDDQEASGPTLIGSATLELLTEWFPGTTSAELQRRFRANLLLETTEPFWEDRLFGPPGKPRPFRIGSVEFLGINPCQRCIVPARNSHTGELFPGFQKQFAEKRRETLPDGIEFGHFNHFYRLAVNTRRAQTAPGELIHCGDEVSCSAI